MFCVLTAAISARDPGGYVKSNRDAVYDVVDIGRLVRDLGNLYKEMGDTQNALASPVADVLGYLKGFFEPNVAWSNWFGIEEQTPAHRC